MTVAEKKRRPKSAKKSARSARTPWGARLEKLQSDLGLTQAELAARLRVTQSMISEYQTGKKVPIKPIQFLIELLEKGDI